MNINDSRKTKTRLLRNKTSALYDQILQGSPKAEHAEPKTIGEYPPELQGPPQNKYGGHQTRKLLGFNGNTYGAAGPCRKLTPEEKAKVEADLRAKGEI